MIVLAFAMPAMAAVTITAVDEGGGMVRIDYSTDANVSAFALEVSVDNDATIEDVCDYHEGESVTGGKGYGIFLDKINGIKINPMGQISDVGTPIANASAPDACGTGLHKSKVILEMGALYEEGNQPDLSGTLCRIQYKLCSYWWITPTTTMTITGNATRGNVVLETASAATTNLPITLVGLAASEACKCIGHDPDHETPDYTAMGGDPLGAYKDYNDWVAVEQPGCWCTDNDPNANPRQCWGDADEFAETKKKWWVSTQDLTVLLAAWNKPYIDVGAGGIQNQTIVVGTLPPITVPLICADFDHQSETKKKWRVSTWDLNILLANWNQDGLPDSTCP